MVAAGSTQGRPGRASDVLPAIDIPKPKVYSAIYEADGHEPKLRAHTIEVDRFPLWLLRKLITREQGKSFVPPCVVLIEDLADGEIGDQVAGASPERAAAAPYFSPHSVALYESLSATGVERVNRQLVDVPQCLLHGDARLDNMFFGPDGSVAALIDWQTATPGPVVVDVAYFMMSSLQHDVPGSVVDGSWRGTDRAVAAPDRRPPATGGPRAVNKWKRTGPAASGSAATTAMKRHR